MAYTLNELGRTLRAQLAEIVTGGDAATTAAADSFITWCTPGMPMEESDFDFAAKGLGTGATAEEEKRLLQQAYVFSTLVDFIPDVSGLLTLDKQVAVFRTSQARLSHMYGEILRLSKVVDQELSPENLAKLERWRGKLKTTRTIKDFITDEEKQVTEDSPAVAAYNKYFADFLAARLEYNNKRIQAAVATGAEGKAAVMDWSSNQPLYRMKVSQAEGNWAAMGYRNEVEQLWAAIGQMTARSMKMWKQRLLESLDDSKVAAVGPGQTFLYAMPIPGNFANAKGWTEYKVYSNKLTSEMEQKSRSWSAGGSAGWGLWHASAGVQSQSSQYSSDFSVSNFELGFELAQIPITRAWFYPEFFMNRGWTLDRGRGWNYDEFPSDGANPPKGNFVGYPTSIIFARKINIKSSEFASAYRAHTSSLSTSASAGWGPFTLRGNYSSSESGRSYESNASGESITVPGMQIIGFVNRLVPKSPNPFPDIPAEAFE
ncbi:hypothetical protein JL100_018245 [Skermanella mucosa]|uniref:hypothetical protein n=1 Tax=Skermanella mucosa TaxID=1789672 RepID=UPI00192B4743|nr:hypothetical protein [Skermanella mucosa]UEM19028.1 hypothetical protein JL100_018245 [Skermanella mucosa]